MTMGQRFGAVIREMLDGNITRERAAADVAELVREARRETPRVVAPAGEVRHPSRTCARPERANSERNELVRIADARVLGESDLALRIEVHVRDPRETEAHPTIGWVPKSCIPAEDRSIWTRGHRGTLAIPRWLAVEKGWALWL